ncbi:hypothetical protein EX895_004748 [Sporisorium graminicola]|uniref:Uncharacterized protein n=1 Tax=Sporisorium graminicola TaxID=280036 RepID=A0A4U7KNZ8_9BASI|nr:hypothetical protein EX895_004748 [Sporisorium graminicola]TKY85923.1 hypothetical protein EX895_004748 [Sporisorium graminicola]
MNKRLDELKSTLVQAPPAASQATKPPQWLGELLKSVPGLPADAVPHNRPKHAHLQSAIAAASLHPAIEACLHLINSDLYSAHFLVRKAQGGSRYLDWLHAVLHKLEGDFRNAKMWYTDLGNTNAGSRSQADDNKKTDETPAFGRFHEFWFVPTCNGGRGSQKRADSLELASCNDLPNCLELTAHGHTDLVFLTSLAVKAASSNAVNDNSVTGEFAKHHADTTLAEDKIKLSQSAFGLQDLQLLYRLLTHSTSCRDTVRSLSQLELVWMIGAMVQDFGWRAYTIADTVDALKVESTPAYQSEGDARKAKASNMVLNPGQGQRKF